MEKSCIYRWKVFVETLEKRIYWNKPFMSWLETKRTKSNTNAYIEREFQVCFRSLTCTRSKVNPQHYMTACCAQLCLTLCNPVDCSPRGSSDNGDSPDKKTEVSCHALLQEIFPTQGSNPGLPHCRQIPYRLSHQGSPS